MQTVTKEKQLEEHSGHANTQEIWIKDDNLIFSGITKILIKDFMI